MRRFTDDEWDRVLEAISARLGHAAALLDGELPPEIADDAASAGLDLLPGGGELGPRCSCPDDADPCKHSAAACYLLADAVIGSGEGWIAELSDAELAELVSLRAAP